MGGRGSTIPGGGTVTLYHSTSHEASDKIVGNGFKPSYADDTQDWYKDTQGQYGYFTRRPGLQSGYGPAVVKVTVPKSAVERDKWSGHWKVPLKHLKDAKFQHHRQR